jgi:arylsulfatase A-like enzyme
MLDRREFCQLSAAAVLSPVLPKGNKKPNVLYILADDLGYGDVGYLNPESKIATPNIDRLASQGIRFTDAHDPTALCTPTRYSILTGRYCWRSRLKNGVLLPWGSPLIEKGRLTVPALLRSCGYDAAAIGKWHLGWDWPTKDGRPPHFENDHTNVEFTKLISEGPTTRGFDSYFGTDVPNYPPYCFIGNDKTVGIPTEVLPLERLYAEAPKMGYGPLDLRPGPMLRGWELVNILPQLTDRAVQYISSRAKQPEVPFFLYFALTGPHTPIVPAPEFQGKSKAGPYGDWVCQLDWTVGQVLAALDRSGMADDTLVIFTSDNGPAYDAYDRAKEYKHYSMGQWRGVKSDMWEGGNRVPFIARWNGRIKAGAESHETICQTDLMATIAAIVGARLPSNAGEDSYNILPALLQQKEIAPIREATVVTSGSGHFAIRQGPWVFIDYPIGGDVKEPAWYQADRDYHPHQFPGELYNLQQDPPERNNLYGERPDMVRKLKTLLHKYQTADRSAPLS